jgi:DNA polymerase I-like protein with 3'-5' exonuclease and polymerase domains
LTKAFDKLGMKSKIIGQIHDSIVLDLTPDELPDVLRLCHDIMTIKLREEWDWITVPLEVEFELTPVDGAWFLKKELNKILY